MRRFFALVLAVLFTLHAGTALAAGEPCCDGPCASLECLDTGCQACASPALAQDAAAEGLPRTRGSDGPTTVSLPIAAPVQPVWCPPD